jgi:hypothetical protein
MACWQDEGFFPKIRHADLLGGREQMILWQSDHELFAGDHSLRQRRIIKREVQKANIKATFVQCLDEQVRGHLAKRERNRRVAASEVTQ